MEFLYPWGVARSLHITLLNWGAKKNGSLHSRAVEQRTEVVKDRVYIHPLPQLVDNIGYVIICVPPPRNYTSSFAHSKFGKGKKQQKPKKRKKKSLAPVWCIIIDCGDGLSVLDQIRVIRDAHYRNFSKNPFRIYSVLSTHKHHDHTAGNKMLWQKFGKTEMKRGKKGDGKKIKNKKQETESSGEMIGGIVGGAIENVPWCTVEVRNGDRVTLPGTTSGPDSNEEGYGNDMGNLVEIECIAVPSHTRGSIVYALRNLPRGKVNSLKDACNDNDNHLMGGSGLGIGLGDSYDDNDDDIVVSHLFTGDAMFSAGAGVPFEADIEFPSDQGADGKKSYTPFKPGAGGLSIERCFAEILLRSLNEEGEDINANMRMLLFPGHEYTLDLLQRQLQRKSSPQEYNAHWEKHNPNAFFELASHYFVMNHRRNLPKCSKLLTVPTSIRKEMKINPFMRSLTRRGEQILRAVVIWYKHGKRRGEIRSTKSSDNTRRRGVRGSLQKTESEYITMPPISHYGSKEMELRKPSSTLSDRSTSETIWTKDYHDVNKSVFTTVYSRDLEQVVEGLKTGTIDGHLAAKKLVQMCRKMDKPAVLRRPLPGTLPSEKQMYMGLVALAVLGSAPSGLSRYDAEVMGLVSPVESSDYLKISKKRLVAMLRRLELLPPKPAGGPLQMNEGSELVQMIDLLWIETRKNFADHITAEQGEGVGEGRRDGAELDIIEVEGQDEDVKDLVELGALKCTLYSVPYNQPSWFSKFCMPCTEQPSSLPQIDPRTKKKLKRSGGELIRHDAMRCPLCSGTVGCPTLGSPDSSDSGENDEVGTFSYNDPVVSSVAGGTVQIVESFNSNDDDVELVNSNF